MDASARGNLLNKYCSCFFSASVRAPGSNYAPATPATSATSAPPGQASRPNGERQTVPG